MSIKRRGYYLRLSGMNRSPASSWKPYSYTFANYESSEGMTHPGWRHAGNSDIGGAWFMDRKVNSCSPIVLKSSFSDGPYFYSNTLGGGTSLPAPNIQQSQLVTDGTKFIRNSAPTNPNASLSVAIGELRNDGLPSVIGAEQIKAKTKFLKGSGSEYLNYEFGWLPLVSDVRKLAMAVRDSHEIIHNYRKDSGKKIRRRRSSEPERNFKSWEGSGYLQPTTPSVPFSGTQTQESVAESWFSGAFMYHVPVGDDVADKLAMYRSNANKLLGLRLTPDVLWNLAPWSWAADWAANTGDVLTNISNLGQDGLVMQYGYSMRHERLESICSFRISGNRAGTFTRVYEQKMRIPASPYGFGLTFDGMTARQKAICAALAITRVR